MGPNQRCANAFFSSDQLAQALARYRARLCLTPIHYNNVLQVMSHTCNTDKHCYYAELITELSGKL